MTIRIRDKKGNIAFEVTDDGTVIEKKIPIQDDKKENSEEEQ